MTVFLDFLENFPVTFPQMVAGVAPGEWGGLGRVHPPLPLISFHFSDFEKYAFFFKIDDFSLEMVLESMIFHRRPQRPAGV